MANQQIFDKRNPGNNEKFFIPLPSDARHYIHHERMSADKMFLYALIIDLYNPDIGCAFPALDTLAVKYGKVPDTTSKHLDDLKAVGLIDFPEKGYYVPMVPLSEKAFFEEFPDAFANYQTSIKRWEVRKTAAVDRMKKWRAERGYANN
ncbi:hypothetical protein [Metabacillus sp. RGM 3146]|uniref:hypothetical protein n=1 Tax=Metabacillus sp. RGM 3146 TaxID=3401092 RepID=UPI003B98FFAD